jgi:hypothetical protein
MSSIIAAEEARLAPSVGIILVQAKPSGQGSQSSTK